MKITRKLTLSLAVGALALAMAVPALTWAQSAAPDQPAPSTSEQAAPAWKMWRGMGWHGRHGGKSLLPATAEVTGLTVDEVRQALQDGKTLTQIAESQGKTADEIVQAARQDLQAMLDQAVASNWMTQERADAKLRAFDDSATERMSSPMPGPMSGRMWGHHGDCPFKRDGATKPGSSTPGHWFQRLRGGSDA